MKKTTERLRTSGILNNKAPCINYNDSDAFQPQREKNSQLSTIQLQALSAEAHLT